MIENTPFKRIALALGWRVEPFEHEGGFQMWRLSHGRVYKGAFNFEVFAWCAVPAFETDLNAMRDARATLLPVQRTAYGRHLVEVISTVNPWGLADASAAEHAEAFCRTLGI